MKTPTDTPCLECGTPLWNHVEQVAGHKFILAVPARVPLNDDGSINFGEIPDASYLFKTEGHERKVAKDCKYCSHDPHGTEECMPKRAKDDIFCRCQGTADTATGPSA